MEEAIAARRSVREFSDEVVTTAEISQLLWAAQGVTGSGGLRASPSAGATYPLEVYVARSSGLHHFEPELHGLTQISAKDLRAEIHAAALKQNAVIDAPMVLIITAVYERTRAEYDDQAERYVDMEAGHAAQNVLLQAVALDLGGVLIGAFDDDRLTEILSLPGNESPLYLIPIGHPQKP